VTDADVTAELATLVLIMLFLVHPALAHVRISLHVSHVMLFCINFPATYIQFGSCGLKLYIPYSDETSAKRVRFVKVCQFETLIHELALLFARGGPSVPFRARTPSVQSVDTR
jgi:hypothetical protein